VTSLIETILREDLYSRFIRTCTEQGLYPGDVIRLLVSDWLAQYEKRTPIINNGSEFNISGTVVTLSKPHITVKEEQHKIPDNKGDIKTGLNKLKLPQVIIDAMLKAAEENKK
jgi:hypothetical protein